MTEKTESKENHSSHSNHTDHTQHTSGKQMITVSKSEMYKNYAIVALVAVIVVIGVFWIGGKVGGEGAATGGSNVRDVAPNAPSAPTRAEVDLGNSPVKGDPKAPITIVEFSDYECPFCARFWSQTLPQLESQYIDTGKVKLVYMDFPLESIHREALPAAHAARCAREQGDDDTYYKYHDLLFQNQQSLGSSNYELWAGQLGLDTNKFSECMDSQKYIGAIREDLQKGASIGIQGTPGFLVNGQLVSGAQPFSVFQQVIESELA